MAESFDVDAMYYSLVGHCTRVTSSDSSALTGMFEHGRATTSSSKVHVARSPANAEHETQKSLHMVQLVRKLRPLPLKASTLTLHEIDAIRTNEKN